MRSDATASVNCGKRCNSMMLTLLLVLFGLLPAYGDQKSIEFRKKTVQLIDAQGFDELETLFQEHPVFLHRESAVAGSLLHTATRKDSEFAVKLLLDAGVDVNSKLRLDQSTPLHSVRLINSTSMAALLLDRGADVNAIDESGKTPIFKALERQHIPLAELLLAQGAEIEHTDTLHGRTPLHYAVIDEKLNAVRWLLDKGANPDVLDKHGSGLIELSVHDTSKRTGKSLELIQLLNNVGLTDIRPAYDYLIRIRRDGYPLEVLVEVDWLMMQQSRENEVIEPLVDIMDSAVQ